MVINTENLEQSIAKYDDQSAVYTDDEEKAIKTLYGLIEGDEELKIWRKYAIKSFVIMGLRVCNLDPAIAFKTLKDLHVLATKTYPDIFGLVDPLVLKPLFERKIYQVVKRADDKGPAIIVMRMGNWHISDGSIEDVSCAAALYFWSVARNSPEIQREGIITIGDMSGFKLKHARQVTIELVKMGVKFHSCLPPEAKGMAKGIIGFNSQALVEDTYKLFKGVLPKDIKKLVFITKNDTSVITKLVDPSRLPMEFGGTIPDEEAYIEGIEEGIIQNDEVFQLFRQIQDEILQVYGLKRTEKKKKDKKNKDKKNKGENGQVPL